MNELSIDGNGAPNDLEMVSVACPLCGEDGGEVVVVGRDREHDLAGRFDVRRCGRCGHHRLDPRPADGQLGKLYPDDYRPFETLPPRGRRSDTLVSLRSRLTDFLMIGPRRAAPPGRLLELGCGSGALLRRRRDQGWSVSGIEPSDSAASRARSLGLDVLTGDDTRLDELPANCFDLVEAFMVIEHTPDPIRTLQRLHRVVADHGVLRLSVPNFGHRTRRRFGSDWYALQVPRHYQHFTRESLVVALELAGWTVERVWHQPTNADFWKSIRLQREGEGREVHWADRVERWSFVIDIVTLPVRIVMAQLTGSSRISVTARAGAPTSTTNY